MKILLVSNSFLPEDGGSYTAISELLYSLNTKGISAKIYHNNNDDLFKLQVSYYVIKKFDIVHIFGIWSPFVNIVIYLAKKLKKKIIVSPIGYLENWSLKQSKIKKMIAWFIYQKKMLERCDYIHATSEQEFYQIKKLNLKNVKIFLLPHGKLNIIYSDLKILKDNKIKRLLFFSRIHKKKGLLELIEAWNILSPQDWELEIIGPVTSLNYKKKIQKKIINYNLGDKVFFSHPVYDEYSKQLKINNSDALILPSKNENFGFSICEAMFLSRIVICSLETPWKEINNAQVGFCMALNNINDLVFALKKIFKLNSNELLAIGKKAKDYLLPKYDLNNVKIYEYIKFYESLMLK
jgi:glycosyltransferase involved in cell wall biosynthesis